MSKLEDVLGRLDLRQYHEAFVQEGFETWETLMDITETDLEAIGVKLGHRRKLQRAILNASSKDRLPLSVSSQWDANEEALRDGDEDKKAKTSQQQTQPTQLRQNETSSSNTTSDQPRSKRKYRRHPKPDEFAPERPPSAYVIFSNQMRDKLKGQGLTFTEIAKLVGERWQELEAHEKEPCEKEAQALKDRYYAELRDYKKTRHYLDYQEYLVEFKAKHAEPKQDSKKVKLQPGSHRPSMSTAQTLSPSANASNSEIMSNGGQSQTNQNDSALESAQNSPVNSSPGSDTYRRFPLAQLLSEEGTSPSYSAWRPAPVAEQRRNSIPNVSQANGADSRPAPSTGSHFGPPLHGDAKSFSDKRSLLNWPMHTMLPPIHVKPADQSNADNISPASAFQSYQPPDPHTAIRLSPRNHTQQQPSSPSKKPTLSTLLLATEHVERDSNRAGSNPDSGSCSNSGSGSVPTSGVK